MHFDPAKENINGTKLIKNAPMTITFLLVFGSYFLFLMTLLYGWEKILGAPQSQSENSQSISVIVPFRNESSNLKSLIHSLSMLRYPKDKLEVILVNDHSTDNSVKILNSYPGNFKTIDLGIDESGKKAALTKGIEAATSEVIITTDADCQHNPDWLNSVNSLFNDAKVSMVLGGVAMSDSQSFFSRSQAIEFASLIGSGASLLYWGIPAMANGANLAFRRNAFFEVKGYEGNEGVASGDDVYLLQKIFFRYPDGVVFNNDPNSVVSTIPQPSLASFFQQRFRWAGKWKYQNNSSVKWAAVSVFFFQMAFLGSFSYYLITHNRLILILLFSKAVLESIFLSRVCEFLNVRLKLLPFAFLQIIYPLYVVITAIGSIQLPFEWKGRKY